MRILGVSIHAIRERLIQRHEEFVAGFGRVKSTMQKDTKCVVKKIVTEIYGEVAECQVFVDSDVVEARALLCGLCVGLAIADSG